MNLEMYLETIVGFIKTEVQKSGAKGVIVGVSGGVDSAVVALLAKKAFPDNHLCLLMPCVSPSIDLECGQELVKKHNLKSEVIDLTTVFNSFTAMFQSDDKVLLGNFKARLRMATVYAYGAKNNYLVLGTDNLDEWYTGYFTKYGDGGVDLLPIVELLKRDVYQAAEMLGVPSSIIARKPSASLWENQEDEIEFGFSYQELDAYLIGDKVMISKDTVAKIEALHKKSEHKRNAIPKAPKWDRK